MQSRILLVLALCALPVRAEATSEAQARATVGRLFDAMKAHDSAAARATFSADARIVAVYPDGRLAQLSGEEFSARLPGIKEAIVERIWNPRMLSTSRLVQIWAEYDFHREGKLHHCGVNSVSVAETSEGWKIAAIVYTVRTEGCPASPLGPLAGQ